MRERERERDRRRWGNRKEYFYDFNRYKVLKKIFKKKKIIFFDVGANSGQTIIEVNKYFERGTIHAFEPQLEKKEELISIKRKLKNFKIFLNFCALGEKKTKKIFFKNIKDNLSSFHKINTNSKLHLGIKKLKKNNSFLKEINIPINVQQITLSEYLIKKKIKKIDILKIDTQNYEENVLNGIKEKHLKNISAIVLEINFFDMYEKNASFYLIEKIIRKHFVFWDISYIYKNPKFFSTDYVDVIYVNQNNLKKIY